MSNKKIFKDGASELNSLVDYMTSKYQTQDYEVQVLDIVDTSIEGKLFQVKNETSQKWLTFFKNVTGLGNTGTVKFIIKNNDLEVEVFGGKWLDKAVVGTISLFMLWPLFVTSSVGAWKQNKLLKQLFEDVFIYFAHAK